MSRFKDIIKTDKLTPDKFKLLYNELLLMHGGNFIRQNENQCLKVIEYVIEFLISSDKDDSTIFE